MRDTTAADITVRNFRDLQVWKKAHALALLVYQATSTFPVSETYGLTSQTRRSAASIPANIAEGCGRSGNRELARFVEIARGSAGELEYHLLLAHDLGFLSRSIYPSLLSNLDEVQKMLTSYRRFLLVGPTES